MEYKINLDQEPSVEVFLDEKTNTLSYIVYDDRNQKAAIIDSVLDFDFSSGGIDYTSADKLISFIKNNKLDLEWIIETHVHADHLSAAPYIQDIIGGKIAIGSQIKVVQDTFGKIFNEGTEFQRDGSQFDLLFEDGHTYMIGELECVALYTPGHTPACMTHVIGNSAFVGDTLFMPDGGSARVDFPGGDAGVLYDSIQKVLSLPDEVTLYMCHDYGPNGREILWKTTVKEQKEGNIHVGAGTSKETFVKLRTERDETLKAPNLILPSLQVNMRAGDIPKDVDGNMTLKIPINKI